MRRVLRWTIVLALFLSPALSNAQLPQFPKSEAEPPQANSQPVTESRQVKVPVVATVNGDPITKPEFQGQLRQNRQRVQVGQQNEKQVRQLTLQSLIESRLIEQFVLASELKIDETQVDATVGRVKKQLAKQQVSYEQFLDSRGYSKADFRKRIKGSLGWQQYQQQQMQSENLQQYFQQNRKLFQAETFQEAQPQVARAYASALWTDVVRQQTPKAEIQIVDQSVIQPAPTREKKPASKPFPSQKQ